jgi:UDPglucose 6-dehydrogenase
MRIAMIGSGYVGLVSGTCLADFGHQVACVDQAEAKIRMLKDGKVPIYEPGLEDLVAVNVRAGRLSFTTDLKQAVSNADIIFIAVGTPSRRGDGHADLSHIYAAAREIAACLASYAVIAIKSTAPVGTGDEVARIMKETNPTADFSVVSNPEFLREGAAINDFQHPDRIVVGLNDDSRAREVMAEVYRPLYLNQAPLLFTSRRTSELIKYAANSFLAMKVTFINEMAELCERVGADVQEVARGIGLDNRIGSKFLNAGPGYGGSCLPKDTLALVRTAQENGTSLRLIETTIEVNEKRRNSMATRILKATGDAGKARTIAILGLTFKPNTDDMREAPSLNIIDGLIKAGMVVRAYDPEGMPAARLLMPDVVFAKDPYVAVEGADALVIVTEWSEFRALDMKKIRQLMRQPLIVDLHNIYKRAEIERDGLTYHGIGKPLTEEK